MILKIFNFFLSKAKPLFGFPPNEDAVNAYKQTIKLLNDLIGDKKYLVGDHLTIADLSVSATTSGQLIFDKDLSEYPNLKRWLLDMKADVPYFDEINGIPLDEMMAYMMKMKAFVSKHLKF